MTNRVTPKVHTFQGWAFSINEEWNYTFTSLNPISDVIVDDLVLFDSHIHRVREIISGSSNTELSPGMIVTTLSDNSFTPVSNVTVGGKLGLTADTISQPQIKNINVGDIVYCIDEELPLLTGDYLITGKRQHINGLYKSNKITFEVERVDTK